MPRLGQHIKPRTAPEPPPISGARWVPLTQGKFALVDEVDYESITTKSWCYNSRHNRAFRKSPPGVRPMQTFLYREIMGVTDPAIQVDHINGDPLDCRRANLRLATNQQNARNNRGHRRRTTPYKGVSPSGRVSKPWSAKITVEGRTVNLGRFTNAEAAARAYDRAAIEYFGEFARLNFSDAA